VLLKACLTCNGKSFFEERCFMHFKEVFNMKSISVKVACYGVCGLFMSSLIFYIAFVLHTTWLR